MGEKKEKNKRLLRRGRLTGGVQAGTGIGFQSEGKREVEKWHKKGPGVQVSQNHLPFQTIEKKYATKQNSRKPVWVATSQVNGPKEKMARNSYSKKRVGENVEQKKWVPVGVTHQREKIKNHVNLKKMQNGGFTGKKKPRHPCAVGNGPWIGQKKGMSNDQGKRQFNTAPKVGGKMGESGDQHKKKSGGGDRGL